LNVSNILIVRFIDVEDHSKRQTTITFPPAPSVALPTSPDKAFMEFINSNRLPFNIVADLSFRHLIKVAQKHTAWSPPSRAIVAGRLLQDGYLESIQHCADIVRRCEKVAITTDGWTGPRDQSYWSATIHGVDSDGVLHVAVLACLAVYRSHTALNISDALRPILRSVDISDDRISAFVTDEGGAAPCVADHFNCASIHCAGHLLQTVLRRTIKLASEKSPVLALIIDASKTVVKLFNNSTERRQQLKSLQRQHHQPLAGLKKDVETRWNSILHSLRSLRDNEMPILNWILNHEDEAKSAHVHLLSVIARLIGQS
jgi:hypothetical protein